jgi:hypothetical protein
MNQIAKGENVAIDPNGPLPTITIKIGSIAIGTYSSYLIKDASHPLICKGQSNQPVKSCPIGTNSSALPGCKVSWQVGIAGTNPNSPFTIGVTLMQGDATLGQYDYSGQGDDLLVDYVTLVSK